MSLRVKRSGAKQSQKLYFMFFNVDLLSACEKCINRARFLRFPTSLRSRESLFMVDADDFCNAAKFYLLPKLTFLQKLQKGDCNQSIR